MMTNASRTWRQSWQTIECSIRGQTQRDPISLRLVLLLITVPGVLYGLVMGSYASVTGVRSFESGIQQMIYSGCKVPLLLLATFLIAFPSFFVVNTLLGLRSDFGIAVRYILECQVTMVVVLFSLSPLVLFWYVSISDSRSYYGSAILINTFCFGLASFASQLTLRQRYRLLIEKEPLHRWMLWAWLMVFAFVGVQMGWVLRPFIGNPMQDPTFFRASAWDNAWLKLIDIVMSLFQSG